MGREEIIKSTMAKSLEWDENIPRQVDTIVALGMATRGNALGSAMLHGEGGDVASMRHVVELVANKLIKKHRISRQTAENIALTALKELSSPFCRCCGGITEVFAPNAVIVTCHVCNGSGLHRHTDSERIAMMGGSKMHSAAYDAALTIMRDAVSEIGRAHV